MNLTLTSGVTTVDTSLLSIVDNDNPKASVQLSSPVYDADEAGGTATVTVTLSHPVDADVTVAYATADGDGAVAGSDYTDTHGTLTFIGNLNNGGTGQTSKTIQIPITPGHRRRGSGDAHAHALERAPGLAPRCWARRRPRRSRSPTTTRPA